MTSKSKNKTQISERQLKPVVKKWCKRLTISATIIAVTAGASIYCVRQECSKTISAIRQDQEKMENVTNARIAELESANALLQQENKSLKQKVTQTQKAEEAKHRNEFQVEVTAYTLSEESCDKDINNPEYGLTANGTNLAGHTLESARAIAVDPRVIPLGSRVEIDFHDNSMKQYNGIYTAVDTGGAINGNRIDIFAGEGAETLAMDIGRRAATVCIL